MPWTSPRNSESQAASRLGCACTRARKPRKTAQCSRASASASAATWPGGTARSGSASRPVCRASSASQASSGGTSSGRARKARQRAGVGSSRPAGSRSQNRCPEATQKSSMRGQPGQVGALGLLALGLEDGEDRQGAEIAVRGLAPVQGAEALAHFLSPWAVLHHPGEGQHGTGRVVAEAGGEADLLLRRGAGGGVIRRAMGGADMRGQRRHGLLALVGGRLRHLDQGGPAEGAEAEE